MPPRKKLKSSTTSSTSTAKKKKSESSADSLHQQPSKFGIQHFFNRHNQTQIGSPAALQNDSNPPPPAPPAERPLLSPIADPNITAPIPQNPNRAALAASTSQISSPPPAAVLQSVPDEPEPTGQVFVSPGASKSPSRKQFHFSPQLLIKLTQDDGGDEITWKISPVNDRLQAVSKHLPDSIKTLADASKLASFAIHHCALDKDKVAQLSSSLAPVRETKAGFKRIKASPEVAISEGSCVSSQPSPFKTPPSLTCHQDKMANIFAGASEELIQRHHKKALIELLDQVEDAISIEDLMSADLNARSSQVQEKGCQQKAFHSDPPQTIERARKISSSSKFLVLEVCEKHGPSDGVAVERPCKVLRLLNEKTGEEQSVYLWEEWYYSVVAPGDTVNVIGEFDESRKCNVDKDHNFLVVHPDILVSGTRVAGSFGCHRRAVLDERLKSFEHSAAALIGTLLHQIFQAALIKENPDADFLKAYARTVIQKNIESLYACGVDENETLKTLVDLIPKMVNWIIMFKKSQDLQLSKVEFGSNEGIKKLRISEVFDIEEMGWAPKYGLKGNIDASLKVSVESSTNGKAEKIMPLEFKTGKVRDVQLSTEHSVQVILYTLLMSERYQEHIDSGLLYYLQPDRTQGIKVRRSDVVGVMMRRNELANDIRKALISQVLPPMLQSPGTCRTCRHLDVCTIYHKVHGGSAEESGLGDVFESNVRHLTAGHHTFLRHWDRLTDLEAKETQLGKNEIWSSNSSLPSFLLDTSKLPCESSTKDNGFIYRFVCKTSPTHGTDGKKLSGPHDLDHMFKTGDFVVLSTEPDQQTITRGVIADINRFHVSVSVSKCLRLPRRTSSEEDDIAHKVWRINKDESVTSFSVMRSNITQLCLKSEESTHLRRMIVDLEAPRFESGCIYSQDPAISYIWSVKSLNSDQRRAILKMLAAKDYALVLGMPGTGKTSTVVHAVRAFLLRGASVLLTSYTNSAIDNLLIKLKAQVNVPYPSVTF
ncbi:unnamed protein product [Linum trigynum]|uniref:DNA helicase n=1 Tax=Linum trigynum TaxID=586398 RepID=A0AAV2FVV5_9ROSI